MGLVTLALSGLGLWAQGSSTITGRITGATGAVIPGTEVTVTNRGTQESRTVLTNDSGRYRVSPLPSGNYEVRATLTGFKTAVGELTLTTGETARVDLTLEGGEVSEVITVRDAAAEVNTEEGRVSTLVDAQRIQDLPLNGRDIYDLMLLAPGSVNVTATVFEPGGSAFGTTVSNVNGGRANMNGFWLDGISSKGLSGGSNIQPSVDAVQEFRIETVNFSAEYGDSAGSAVNVVTRSGTNAFHGSLFAFHRNDNLDAREFFDSAKPEFKQNQFGGSFGGPIIENSTFFFGSYEGTRIRTGESALGIFESQAWANFVSSHGAPVGRFLFDNFPGRPLENFDPEVDLTVGKYLEAFFWSPSSSQADVDAVLGSLFGSAPGALSATAPMVGTASFFTPDSTDTDQFSIRVDQEIGDNAKIFGRYFITDQDGAVVNPRPAFSSPFKQRSHQLLLNWTQIVSPTLVNEARGGLNRFAFDILAGTPGVPLIADEGSLTSVFGAYNGYPQIFHENGFTFADTLSVTRGNHGVKLGAEVRRNQENSEFNVGRPSYHFFDLVYLALDDPYYQIGGVDPHLDQGPGHAELASNFRGWRNWEIGFFFNDDWKVSPNLTLNLGVRWDWFSRLREVHNRATAFAFGEGDNIFVRLRNGDFTGPVDSLSAEDYNNFAPRIGFAWDPRGDGRMSIRGGYGIAYNDAIYNPLANSRWNKPFYSFNLICDVCGRPGEVVLYGPQDGSPVRAEGANPNVGGRLFDGNIIAYDPFNPNLAFLNGIPNPEMRDPYVQSYFFGVQREIFRHTTFEANYVGTLGRKLIRAENFNRFTGDRIGLPSPTGEFAGDRALNFVNPNEGTLRFWENSVNSSYHSLQTQINRRFSGGFAFNGSYTFAKSLDVRSTWHSGATSSNLGQEGFSTDVEDVRLDYGRSIFDARHRVVTNWLWDIPFLRTHDSAVVRNLIGGWQLNGIVSLQSGQPFTPFTELSFPGGGDFNADGTNNDRPNTPGGGNSLSGVERNDWVNPNNGPFNFAASTYADRLAFFGRPANGTNGTLGRNTFEGPGFANVDFSFFKEVGMAAVTEGASLQIRFEFFNLGNRPNFFQPEPRLNSGNFGRATETFDAREIQLGLKFIF